MWKEAMLQGLVALLPAFLFVVWYDRPSRQRYAALSLTLLCGTAMLLNHQFSTGLQSGIHMDLRTIPLLVGSLFGGCWAAIALSALEASIRIPLAESLNEVFLLLAAYAILFSILIKCSRVFMRSDRMKRMRIVLLFMGVMTVFMVFRMSVYLGEQPPAGFQHDVWLIAVYWLVFLVSLWAEYKWVELAFDRVGLQSEVQDMSRKYRGEVRRLQQFIDQAPLSVVFLNAEGVITHVNDACLELLHPLSRRQLVRHYYQPLAGLFSPPIEKVLNGKDGVTEMVRFRDRSVYVLARAIKGSLRGSEDGILVIGHDVTELERLRDEVGRMERLSLVGQMAASITHEIRNPMAVIRGFMQLLNERSTGEQRAYFRIVMDELDRANGIINDFLSLAQNRIVPKEPASLHDILQEVMPLLHADANMRGQVVELELSGEAEPLNLNSKEIKQLVLNLARNGMEAMGDNGLLQIRTVNLPDTVELRVTDNGVGIPADKKERLFEPFYTTKNNGTGLGLPLCLSIVERHNGKIAVDSSVGAGTTFIVSFRKRAG